MYFYSRFSLISDAVKSLNFVNKNISWWGTACPISMNVNAFLLWITLKFQITYCARVSGTPGTDFIKGTSCWAVVAGTGKVLMREVWWGAWYAIFIDTHCDIHCLKARSNGAFFVNATAFFNRIQWVVWIPMRLFIWCDFDHHSRICVWDVAHEWVPYLFYVIAMCYSNIYTSHFSYACKMRCPLNLVLENCEYLWFYLTFWIVILDYGLKLHKLSIHTLVMLLKWLEIH